MSASVSVSEPLLRILRKIFSSVLVVFQRPFPLETRSRRKVAISVLFGVFIAAFLLGFEPFGLSRATNTNGAIKIGLDKSIVIAFYGVITTVVMLFNFFALPLLFPRAFDEERWTLGKHIAFMLLNIALIAVCNYAYSRIAFGFPLALKPLLYSLLWTLTLGIFPTTMLSFVIERRLWKQHSTAADLITTRLERSEEQSGISAVREISEANEHNGANTKHATSRATTGAAASADDNQSVEISPQLVVITGASAKERFDFQPASILCVQAGDNYVTVFYEANQRVGNVDKVNDKVNNVLLRATMKSVEEQLQPFAEPHSQPKIVRCHKSFIVNLSRVERVTGNAQGYKLHLPLLDFPVSVSRALQNHIVDELQHLRDA
jgi:DNA-binding LytR/AlgR family response regulator